MTERLYRSVDAPQAEVSSLLRVTREEVGWDLIDFQVWRIPKGLGLHSSTRQLEVCLVLLKGQCRIRWQGGSEHLLGPRPDVFSAYPSAVYLPPDTDFVVSADETTELADGRVMSEGGYPARVVAPHECGFEIRGGGNATRQIIDVMPPEFPADRILVCEVLTPAGSWSSYPPHKHDVDNPPAEVDLDEIYYYRFEAPEAYGFQRLYTADGRVDETHLVRHGDLLPIREGYHPFVTAHGYNAYYLNVLAGSRRSMAATDDPGYAHFRSWPPPDPRMPLIQRPEAPRGS